MAAYSEHRDLQQLHEKIDKYTSSITNFEFSGSGLNDLTAKAEILAFRPVHIQLRISSTSIKVDSFKWSDDSGRNWRASNVIITGNDQSLDHGVAIKFNTVRGHTMNDLWKFTANPPESLEERQTAYDWVNDQLRARITVPVSSPSKVVILAEANYAIYLILRKKGDKSFTEFRTEAGVLIAQYIKETEADNSLGGPVANSANVMPQFTREKRDFDDNLLGRVMGRSEAHRGSLDDW